MCVSLWQPQPCGHAGCSPTAPGLQLPQIPARGEQAILLGGLALKRRWQEKRKADKKDSSAVPNIVCSKAVHVRAPFFLNLPSCFFARSAINIEHSLPHSVPPCRLTACLLSAGLLVRAHSLLTPSVARSQRARPVCGEQRWQPPAGSGSVSKECSLAQEAAACLHML